MSATDCDMFSFLSHGSKLYVRESEAVFLDKLSNNTTVVAVSDIDTISDQKFDLIVLPYTFDMSFIKRMTNLLSDNGQNGQIVFCVKNTSIISRTFWCLNIFVFKILLKYVGLTKRYFSYLSPGFESTVQVISSHKFLSQQYFRQHYDWRFTAQQSTIKRVIKYLVFKTNTFYLLEQSCILGFQKC